MADASLAISPFLGGDPVCLGPEIASPGDVLWQLDLPPVEGPLRDIFGLATLAFAEWSVLLALPPAMLALEEGRKWLVRKRRGA